MTHWGQSSLGKTILCRRSRWRVVRGHWDPMRQEMAVSAQVMRERLLRFEDLVVAEWQRSGDHRAMSLESFGIRHGRGDSPVAVLRFGAFPRVPAVVVLTADAVQRPY